MNETLDALLQLYERTVRHYVDHFALGPAAHRIFLLDVFPGAGRLLLQSKCDSFPFLIHVQNDDLDLLLDGDHL